MKGAERLSPAFFSAAVSVWRTMPTCAPHARLLPTSLSWTLLHLGFNMQFNNYVTRRCQ